MPAVVVDSGQNHYVDCADPATRAAQTTTYFGGYGSGGATLPDRTQTTLVAEFADARGACTITQPAADKIRYAFMVTAGANRTASESAAFTASTAGTMLIRGTHPDRSVLASDDIEYGLVARMRAAGEA
jgi:hypothetical protein